MYTPSVSYPDVHLTRLLEETIHLCNDLDARVNALRIGIAQAVPALAHHALARRDISSVLPFVGLGAPIGSLPISTPLSGLVSPFGSFSPGVSPFLLGSSVPTQGIWPGVGLRGF